MANEAFLAIPDDAKADFLKLCTKLSPENLSCDGELSRAQTDTAYQRLMTKWRALEGQYGISVSQDDVMQWQSDQMTARRSVLAM